MTAPCSCGPFSLHAAGQITTCLLVRQPVPVSEVEELAHARCAPVVTQPQRPVDHDARERPLDGICGTAELVAGIRASTWCGTWMKMWCRSASMTRGGRITVVPTSCAFDLVQFRPSYHCRSGCTWWMCTVAPMTCEKTRNGSTTRRTTHPALVAIRWNGAAHVLQRRQRRCADRGGRRSPCAIVQGPCTGHRRILKDRTHHRKGRKSRTIRA